MQNLKRNYGIDLLKVVLAAMVIVLHINANGTGQVLVHAVDLPWHQIILLATILCYPAVNTYILITGYYSYGTKKDYRGILKALSLLWLSAVFFSVFGYLLTVFYGNAQFILIDFFKRFFPIIRGGWWFYTVYFALMLVSPFLNKLVDSISLYGLYGLRFLLILLLLLLSVFPIFDNWESQLGSNYGYSLIWFITLYLFGAYLYRLNILQHNNKFAFKGLVAYIGASFIMIIWPTLFRLINIDSTVSTYNSFICTIQALGLFIFFGNIRIANRLIKYLLCISPFLLASYLLHCQEDIEKVLWVVINPAKYANDSRVILISSAIIFLVISIGIILEFIRNKLCCLFHINEKIILASDLFCSYLERKL